MSCADLPAPVKTLIPKENLDYAASITPEEAIVLKEVFSEHDCFEEVGEMIDSANAKSPELASRMKNVLEANKARLQGLSPAAVDYSKKIIHFVTLIQCHLTLGKECCLEKAKELHEEFQALSDEDKLALKKNNPDLTF